MDERKGLRSTHLARLRKIMPHHIGRQRAIGMGELFEDVFGRPWQNRINDTRALRHLITEARREGDPICSDTSSSGGGYFYAAASSELEEFCALFRRRAIRSLMTESRIRKISLPELLGQMQLRLKEGKDAA